MSSNIKSNKLDFENEYIEFYEEYQNFLQYLGENKYHVSMNPEFEM